MRQDLRAAVRSFAKSPTFTAVALAVIALGIGSATAVFSLVDVMRRAGVLMAIGLVLGGAAAWALSRTVETFLFQTEPTDPRVFVGALVTLTLAGLVASAVPARRAASVDPLVALRHE